MNVSIIILNWNAGADTIDCIKPMLAWRRLQPVIWVVDNASHDDSIQEIEQALPSVHLIRNTTNQGFSGGSNRGIEAALAAQSYPVLLLNNDASIDETSVLRLLLTLEEETSIGIVGPGLYDAERPERRLSVGGKNPVLHHQTRHEQGVGMGPLYQVNTVSGTAVLIRADLFARVGLFDEAYFFSTEMADLCARAKTQGYHSVIDSRAKAYHTVSRSASHRNTLYMYYIVRNRFIYIRKFYSHITQFGLLAFWFFYTFLLILKLRFSGETASALAVQLAMRDGWQKRFGGQNERVLRACQSDSEAVDAPFSPSTP